MYSFDGMAIDPSRDYETESAGHTNRVANAAVTYFGSQFSMQAAVETVFWENNSKFNAKLKDSTDIGLSFQYDFNWKKYVKARRGAKISDSNAAPIIAGKC